MDRLVFNSNATMREQAIARQNLVNNLANVSTVGFKSSYDVALQSVKVNGPGFDSRYQAQAIARDIVRMDPGPVMATGKALDIAMDDRSVLAVQAPNGELAFTRRGDLRVNVLGQLETGAGHLVLGEGGPINIPPNLLISISTDGTVYAKDPVQPNATALTRIDQLSLRDASNVQLVRREDGLFKVPGKPGGTDFTSGPHLPRVIPEALEGSNVSPVDAMTRLMDHARTFETQVRIIKETKTIDENGSSMMKNG